MLDRSQALEAEPALDEGQDNEYLKAFKVANFAYAEDEAAANEIQAEDARLEAELEEEKQRGREYWEELLRSRWEDAYVRQEVEMGKGRRSRKQVSKGLFCRFYFCLFCPPVSSIGSKKGLRRKFEKERQSDGNT